MAFGRNTTRALRVELNPFERIVIGNSVIVNSGSRVCFPIIGDARVRPSAMS
jgi:Flagellar protein FlbT